MVVSQSLIFYEVTKAFLEGNIIRLEAQRGTPEVTYNTRLFTDRNEEVWFSGVTCGKEHAGARGLCELVSLIGWDKYVPKEEVVRIVLSNNSFRMEFHPTAPEKKMYVFNGWGKT